MTLAAIEFNDQSLLIQAEDDTRYGEPGFAQLVHDGVVTGEAARGVAWREPQHTYNQFWCHLNQTPLTNRHRFARHHGDIAFAQLSKLWREAGEPDSLILLPPGGFTRAQLSLLLGMVGALPAKTRAVMDSALAACLDADGDTLYVDLHLHETVCTVVKGEPGSVAIEDQEVFPGVGIGQIHNSIARHISDRLIESYRFDPLHSSETEQTIYDHIPHWLTRLGWEDDISVKLESDKGDLPCILRKVDVERLIAERIVSIEPFLDEWPDCNLVLSHHSGLLAGLSRRFSEARVARRTAATRRALAHQDSVPVQDDELYRIRAVERAGAEEAAPRMNGEALATHLLCGELALPLSRPLSIRVDEHGPRMRNEMDREAALTLVLRGHGLEALHGAADASLPRQCRPGESIRVGGHELKLIRVDDA